MGAGVGGECRICAAPGFLDSRLRYAARRNSYCSRFEWRAIRQLFEAPALVVAFDERSDGRAHLGEVSKDPAVDGLLLERAIPALDDPVGFRPVLRQRQRSAQLAEENPLHRRVSETVLDGQKAWPI